MKRILWGITGSGHNIQEIIDIILDISKFGNKVNIILSKAGEQVLRWYGLWDSFTEHRLKVQVEVNANSPFLAGPLQVGHYDYFVVAPLTANSTAKIALGIADTLLTNAVAQTLKGNTPVIVYPVDQIADTIETRTPDGTHFTITPRHLDLANVAKLKDMRGLTVVESPSQIPKLLE